MATCFDLLTVSLFYFDTELYMFRTDLLFIVRNLNTVHTAIGICRASSVDCLVAVNRTSTTDTNCCVYSIKILLMMDSRSVRNM